MKSLDEVIDALDGTVKLLSPETISEIDFDNLRGTLTAVVSRLSEVRHLRSEVTMLRTHEQARLTGMLKAIAVAVRSRDRTAAALDTIESLEHMSAAELVTCSRRTSAQFRDCFSNSFQAPGLSVHSATPSSVLDFK